MLNIDCQVLHPEENDLKVTYNMRELCGPYDGAVTETYEMNYATGFNLEELIASCAADGAVDFFKQHGKRSVLTYIKIERN